MLYKVGAPMKYALEYIK